MTAGHGAMGRSADDRRNHRRKLVRARHPEDRLEFRGHLKGNLLHDVHQHHQPGMRVRGHRQTQRHEAQQIRLLQHDLGHPVIAVPFHADQVVHLLGPEPQVRKVKRQGQPLRAADTKTRRFLMQARRRDRDFRHHDLFHKLLDQQVVAMPCVQPEELKLVRYRDRLGVLDGRVRSLERQQG